ncbi:helix-turn-helix transcriptional regulator [Micrococcus luteus]|uniref:helix-turn-helix transcriptional regulator n=1 Tax=Micrococcus luteus TaxID=1270 RepID=UPI00203CE10E|nr:response regulator transcription factor [Micrococcus luteus]MCM3578484.1 response regulator transcription factor [Micrococcus luteus]MCV7531053.1 response regulator transcription factor [Micrococcus luteus]
MSAADLRPRELDPRRAVSVQEITVMVLPDAGVRGGVRVRTSRTGVVGDIRLVEGAVSGDLDSADLLLGGVNSLGETRQVARQGRDVPPFLLVAEATIVEELPGIDASGAAAVLAYPLDTVELASVAHGIAGSGPFLSPRLPQLSVEPLGEGLSAREAEVVVALGEGLSDAEIAQALCVSVKTVHTHVLNLRRKLGARNRAHAVSLARSVGPLGDACSEPGLVAAL